MNDSRPGDAPGAAAAEPEGHSRRVTLTVAASFFMLLLDGTILNTSLPAMASALHVRPLTRSFPYRVSVIVPEHRPKSLLVDAFADALRGEAKAIRRRLAALPG